MWQVICLINQDKCNEALLFASMKHEGQKMKQPIVSYVTHLQGVCLEAVNGCLNSGVDVDLEKVIIVSLLHDTLEDTETTYDDIDIKFGKDIADAVQALTKNDKLPNGEQMKDSLQRIQKQGREVAIVKLADRIFNLKDIPMSWNKEKVDVYREEAKMILEQIGFYNEYMAERLRFKIDCYKK